MLATSYRVVPASEISFDQDSVSYILTKNLKPRVVPSLSSIISAPEFGDEATRSNYLVISYMDNEVNYIDSVALKWEGMREGFGWSILKLGNF
jgi:hypothetical protein